MTAPIVKWVGGKTQLLPELMRRMPEWWRTYHEPFAGGAALFFHLRPGHAYLNDINAKLIQTYVAVRDNVRAVIHALDRRRDAHCERYYYDVRARWNLAQHEASRAKGSTIPATVTAADFIYLNKCCFNGLWRENSSGEFNVPMGRYQNPRICVPEDLRAASDALRSTHLSSVGFYDATRDVGANEFVYFDPPYDPISKTASFTNYSGKFGELEQKLLATIAADLVARSAFVMLSNSDTKFVRSLYPKSSGFRIDRVRARRSVNSNAAKRGAVNEVIITGGYKIPRSRRAS
jgi:DNA adenine methylase